MTTATTAIVRIPSISGRYVIGGGGSRVSAIDISSKMAKSTPSTSAYVFVEDGPSCLAL